MKIVLQMIMHNALMIIIIQQAAESQPEAATQVNNSTHPSWSHLKKKSLVSPLVVALTAAN